jgi:hypothetical protein
MENLMVLNALLLSGNYKDALPLMCDLLCGLVYRGSEITDFSITAADGTKITIEPHKAFVDTDGDLHL